MDFSKEEILEEINNAKAKIKHKLSRNQSFILIGFGTIIFCLIFLIYDIFHHKYFSAVIQAICIGINIYNINILNKSMHKIKEILRHIEEREIIINNLQ